MLRWYTLEYPLFKQKERFRENFQNPPCFSCGELQVYQSIVEAYNRNTDADRIICITDEQDNGYSFFGRNDTLNKEQCMKIGRKIKYPYMLNVAPYQNGICYPKANDSWVHINGFSENVIKYIALSEK